MDTYDFVHIAIHLLATEERDGKKRIRGRTLLQKKIYFLGLLSGQLEGLGYDAHYYGPYSTAVANSVDRLRELGFLEQTVSGSGRVDNRGFEIGRYDYALTDDGITIVETKLSVLDPELRASIEAAARKLRSTRELDYVALSIAAKAYFVLLKRRVSMTSAEILTAAEKFNWHVAPAEIDSAIEYLKDLRIVDADRVA